MNTLNDLRGMTVQNVGSWSYQTLDVPEETKAMVAAAERDRDEKKRITSQGNEDVYMYYKERTENKGKGEDLFNDVCAVFRDIIQIIRSEEDICSLAPQKKQDIEAWFNAVYQIRNDNRSPFADVRTVLDSQLPNPLPGFLSTDYNVMIFTVAKTRVDACLKHGIDDRQLSEVLRTHFLQERNIVSNCVDIPIVPYIEPGRKAAYFNYLTAAVDAVRGLTEAVLSYLQLKEDLKRHHENHAAF